MIGVSEEVLGCRFTVPNTKKRPFDSRTGASAYIIIG
jgi:hypothetical protein